jgi:hypothetical protein
MISWLCGNMGDDEATVVHTKKSDEGGVGCVMRCRR